MEYFFTTFRQVENILTLSR